MGLKARWRKPAAVAALVLGMSHLAADVASMGGSSSRRFWPITAAQWSAGTNARAALFWSGSEIRSHAPRRTLALLIDGYLIGPAWFEPLFDAVRTRGSIADARIYAPQASVRSWSAKLKEYGIKPVVPCARDGTEDPKRMAMAADAEEICLRPCGDRISAVVIASHNFEIVSVLRSVHAWGYSVFAAAPALGRGSLLQHELEEASGNRVVHYAAQMMRTIDKRVTLNLTDPLHGIDISECAPRGFLSLEELEQLKSVLRRHGYACAPPNLLLAACAKFFHVNQLGTLTVWPVQETLHDTLNAIAQHGPKNWRRNPGDLMFVEPVSRPGRGSAESKGFRECVKAGGPFMLRAEARLVDTMLRRLAYTEDEVSAQSIENFWSKNRKALLKHGFAIGDPLSTQKQKLYDIFRSEGTQQKWKVAGHLAAGKSRL